MDGQLSCMLLAMDTLIACNTYSMLARIKISRTRKDSSPSISHLKMGILKWYSYWRTSRIQFLWKLMKSQWQSMAHSLMLHPQHKGTPIRCSGLKQRTKFRRSVPASIQVVRRKRSQLARRKGLLNISWRTPSLMSHRKFLKELVWGVRQHHPRHRFQVNRNIMKNCVPNILIDFIFNGGRELLRRRILSRRCLCTGSFRQTSICVSCAGDCLFMYCNCR